MKILLAVLLLSALSFGQTPMTKAQKQDCAKLTKAFKKHATDPGLTPDDVAAMLAAVHEACGTPQEQATSTQDCESAMAAVDQDVKKNGIDPTSSRPVLNALIKTMRRSCGLPDEEPPVAPAVTQPANGLGAASDKLQPSPDIHELMAQRTSAMNREIALGNRLIAHFQKAQTWEGIDADHPEAVALREKIAQEEKELHDAIVAGAELSDKIDLEQVKRECTVEEITALTQILQETASVMRDVKTQQDRYHALGY